jgi:hypothetical protein
MRSRLFLIISGFLICLSAHSRQPVSDGGGPGYFPLDGSTKEADGKGKPGKMIAVKAVADRFGQPGKALGLSFDYAKGKESRLYLPVNINPDKYPQLTLTFWIKMNRSNQKSWVITLFDNLYNQDSDFRGLYTRLNNGYYRYTACCGKDGLLEGEEVTAGNWTFIALVYDRDNQAMRLVVNDRVFASPARMMTGADKIRIGPFDGNIDELRIFPRVLSLDELAALSGSQIVHDTTGYPIEKRTDYRALRDKESMAKIHVNDVFTVATGKLSLHDTAGSFNVTSFLEKTDTFRIERIEGKSAFIRGSGKEGYVTLGTIGEDAYPRGSSYFAHEAGVIFRSIFNFTLVRSWIIAVVCAVLLFFVVKKYDGIDRLINRLGRRDPLAGGGSKREGGTSENFLKRIFPLKRMRWWPLLIGAILALVVLVSLFWDSRETEWFLNGGISFLPKGFTRSVHWFLYISLMILAVMYLVMILESFVLVGPWLAPLRVLILTLLIFMAVLVTFYLSVLLLIIAVVMLVLYMFAAGTSRSEYRCPHCYRSFTSTPGSSGSCPYCGGGVTT